MVCNAYVLLVSVPCSEVTFLRIGSRKGEFGVLEEDDKVVLLCLGLENL